MDERSTELAQEVTRLEQHLARLPEHAVSPSRREAQRDLDIARDLLAYETARRDAAAAGKTWNARAFRWAKNAGKSTAEAINAALEQHNRLGEW